MRQVQLIYIWPFRVRASLTNIKVAQLYCGVFGGRRLDSKKSTGSKLTLNAEAGLRHFGILIRGSKNVTVIDCEGSITVIR